MALIENALAGIPHSARPAHRLRLSRCAGLFVTLLGILPFSALAADPPPAVAAPVAASRIMQQAPDANTLSWRTMLLAKHNGPGCYKADYPDRDWTAVPCLTPRTVNQVPAPVKLQSGAGLRPAITGNNNDYVAVSSVGTTSASGSIIEIDNLTSESDSGFGSGKYSLQMNTNGFTPPKTTCASCTGWVQFYYDQNGGAIEVQYWMFNYITSAVPACPQNWKQAPAPYITNCYTNGTACLDSTKTSAPAPIVPLADLPQVTLMGESVAAGNDTVTLLVGTQMVQQAACGSILSLQGKWTSTEFNVFGDFNSDVATFNTGVLMTVDISLADASDDFPSCSTVSGSGATTLETTNMVLASCQPTRPGIRFVEGVPPRIGSLSPIVVAQNGGTNVLITGAADSLGSGFGKPVDFSSPVMMTDFGNNYSAVSCTGDQCRAQAPGGTGSVPVSIANLTSAGVPGPFSTEAFSVSYVPFPEGSLSPTEGPQAGGTTVTLTGQNLGLSPGATTITFDFGSGPVTIGNVTCSAVPSTNTSDSGQICTFTTPAYPNLTSSGSRTVFVSATVGGLTSTVGSFSFLAAVPTPPTCEQCIQQGKMCILRNGKPVCVCQRSSPTGVCQ